MKTRFLLACLLAALPPAVPAAAQVRMLASSPHVEDPLAGPQVADPLTDAPPIRLNLLSPEQTGDTTYAPEVGQAGKDVIWVPTPDSLIKAMLTVAAVTPDDVVVDLGAGDGRIAIAAARDFGARAQGIEYNADMVALARRNAIRAGVPSKATFVQGDIFETDFSRATVVTMYLLPSLNLKLRDTILKMKPGTRVVSHAFNMGDWEPERTISTDDATAYYWVVPANARGRWAFEVGGERFVTEIGQTYQKLGFARGGPLKDGRLNGATISLTRADGSQLTGEVKGGQMGGRGWVATRIGGS
jgi:SAM-dependent methyltransferase